MREKVLHCGHGMELRKDIEILRAQEHYICNKECVFGY